VGLRREEEFYDHGNPLSPLLDNQLLAGDAIPAPRYRGQSIHADVLAAMQAFAKRAAVDPADGRFHQLQQPAFQRFLGQPIFEVACLWWKIGASAPRKDDRKKPFLAPQARAQHSRA